MHEVLWCELLFVFEVASIAAECNNFHIEKQEQLICRDHQSSPRNADWEVVFSSCHQMCEQSQLNVHSLSHPAFSAWDQEAGRLTSQGVTECMHFLHMFSHCVTERGGVMTKCSFSTLPFCCFMILPVEVIYLKVMVSQVFS